MAEVQLQHIGRGPLVRHQDMGSTFPIGKGALY